MAAGFCWRANGSGVLLESQWQRGSATKERITWAHELAKRESESERERRLSSRRSSLIGREGRTEVFTRCLSRSVGPRASEEPITPQLDLTLTGKEPITAQSVPTQPVASTYSGTTGARPPRSQPGLVTAAPLSARPRHRAALACYHHSRLRRRSCVPVTFLCSSLPPPPPGSAFSSAAMLDVQKALLYISQSTVVWKETEGGRLP
ncbi:uncharacterized protein LOC118225070 isoform X2 [Anguilla anguilla]|uniref:uncharacterized protein LOC118225070 isoform X2 n=1 Tax=Anguilla anguilla TaxID=7936 RepID=UPI0015AA8032|nr:uncharacterized protein LOC118225070 isoform X2 [Anguilla anguilla]